MFSIDTIPSQKYFCKSIFSQCGEAVRMRRVMLYHKYKKYWICARVEGDYKYYELQLPVSKRVIGTLELLYNKEHVVLSMVRTRDAKYRGVGRALFQVSIEEALRHSKTLLLSSCYNSAGFHYKCGALPLENNYNDLITRSIDEGGRDLLPHGMMMKVEHERALRLWKSYIYSHPIIFTDHECRKYCKLEQRIEEEVDDEI